MKPKRKIWKKVLYGNEDYPDNYTDPTFLKDLRTNLNVRFYTLIEVVKGVTILNNQISSITGFLIIFYSMYNESCSPTTILWPSFLTTILGYIYFRRRQLTLAITAEDSKTLLTVLLFGYLFAPILHTLTDAVSTDTIFSMTFFVFFLNVIFCDYGLSVAMVSKTISLNAAIFGSICLASRLSTSYHAFVLLVEAAIFFVLYPIVTKEYWRPSMLIPIFLICCYCLYYISTNVLLIYVFVVIFVNIVCPCIFVVHQRYKHNIHGPWDEAIVEETTGENFDLKL